MMRRFIRWYGAGPVHLLALLGSAALAAYAVTRIPRGSVALDIGVWFAGTLVVHDLVLFPLYAAADNAGSWRRRRLADRTEVALDGRRPLPWINHVRVPTVLSGLLLLTWLPLVLRLSSGYEDITGRSDTHFLGNWLLVTAALYLASALLYAIRSAGAVRRP